VTSDLDRRVFNIHRPAPELMTYYLLGSLLLGPFFFIPLIPLYFRYHTMHYDFDEEGISMRWGILFRREITLTYARIQDIHLTSNILERWLRLARIQIQTASGSASAEMTIEGLHEFAMLRDFLYSKMRGVTARHPERSEGSEPRRSFAVPAAQDDGDLAAALREVAAELRAVREALSKRP
jgi:putative membrane protein